MTPRLPVSSARTALTAALAALALAAVPGCSRPEEPPDVVGPASAYIDLVLDVTAESAAQQAIAYEEVVAACMTDAGFEYLPNTGSHVFGDDSGLEHPPDSREFAEQYGYGMAVVPDGLTSGPLIDPNRAYIEAMSASEAAEYYQAYIGDWVGSDSGEEPDWQRMGCTGKAMLEVYRSGAAADATYLALKDEVDRIEADVVPTHPDVVRADAEWSDCMADAGYPDYTRQPEAKARWMDHMNDSDGNGIVEPTDAAAQAQLAPEEIALATADWDCRDRTGYDDVVARVRNTAQQEYVDAHRDELDAWVERWGEQ